MHAIPQGKNGLADFLPELVYSLTEVFDVFFLLFDGEVVFITLIVAKKGGLNQGANLIFIVFLVF